MYLFGNIVLKKSLIMYFFKQVGGAMIAQKHVLSDSKKGKHVFLL